MAPPRPGDSFRPDAFFRPEPFPGPDGSRLVPDGRAHSPWSTDMLHGRLLAALAARQVERSCLAEGFRVVRVTTDLFRAAPMEPLEVTAGTTRAGGRVRTATAVITCAGREVARTDALMLRTGADPGTDAWAPPPWAVPGPDQVGPMSPEGAERSSLDVRLITEGGFMARAQKRLWIREVLPLVAGEETSPVVRAVAAADLANPFSNAGPGGLAFINADLTVYLGRQPEGEWIGLEVADRVAADGVAVADCRLFDLDGGVGRAAVASVATAPFDDGV